MEEKVGAAFTHGEVLAVDYALEEYLAVLEAMLAEELDDETRRLDAAMIGCARSAKEKLSGAVDAVKRDIGEIK